MTEELPTFLIGIKPINLIRREKTLSISCYSARKARDHEAGDAHYERKAKIMSYPHSLLFSLPAALRLTLPQGSTACYLSYLGLMQWKLTFFMPNSNYGTIVMILGVALESSKALGRALQPASHFFAVSL